jgi:proline dehydrogenase
MLWFSWLPTNVNGQNEIVASTTLPASNPNLRSQTNRDETLHWHSAEDLLPWESDWRDLDHAAQTPWSTWKGTHAMLLSCATQEQPCVHGLQSKDKLVAVAPLSAHAVGKSFRLMPLGYGLHPFPFEIVAIDPAARSAIVREMVGNDLPLSIPRMRDDSETIAVFQDECRKGTLLKIQRAAPTYSLDLTAGWTDPLKNLNTERRSEFRLVHRRSEPFGLPEFRVWQPQLTDFPTVLADIRRFDQNAWKIQAEPSDASELLAPNFESAILRKFIQTQQLRIHQLLFQGQLAAIFMSAVHQNKLWILKSACDPRFAKCSPSLLLLEKLIADSAERKLTGIEFHGAQDPFVQFWGPKPCEHISLKTIPYNRAGLSAWLGDVRQSTYHHSVERLKAPLKSILFSAGLPIRKISSFAARCYCAGGEVPAAIAVQRGFHAAGFATMVGFQADAHNSPETIAREYQLALRSLDTATSASPKPAFLIQASACDINMSVLSELADICQGNDVRLCFDATWHAATDATLAAIEGLRKRGLKELSVTLPARWKRSIDDAKWVIEQGVGVRLVSGRYPDPTGDVAMPRENFLEIARRLAGRVDHVAIAAPEMRTAEAILEILGDRMAPEKRRPKAATRSAKTGGDPAEAARRSNVCELEVLYGTSRRAPSRLARKWGVDVRVFIPYGRGELPYAFRDLLKQPQMPLWFTCDLFGRFSRKVGRLAKV